VTTKPDFACVKRAEIKEQIVEKLRDRIAREVWAAGVQDSVGGRGKLSLIFTMTRSVAVIGT
jgi:hypothetical protein